MFGLLNVIYYAGMMLVQITLYSEGDYPFQEKIDSVTHISMHREWWRDDGKGKCQYTGVMVPFARDWEKVIQRGKQEVVMPPDPNKIAGQAFIINRKVCGDKVEPVFRVGEIWSATGAVYVNHHFPVFDATDEKPDHLPKWLSQVLRRIERVAVYDEKAKAFVTDVKASTSTLKMTDSLKDIIHGAKESSAPVATTVEKDKVNQGIIAEK